MIAWTPLIIVGLGRW